MSRRRLSSLTFKKHYKPKPKKIPPAEAERPRSELTEKFRAYIENLLLATQEELASVRERERLLAASLPEDILEVRTQIFHPNIYFVNSSYLQVRGLAITNLRLDQSHQGGAEASKQEFSVRLVRADSSKSMPSGGWRWVNTSHGHCLHIPTQAGHAGHGGADRR